MHQTIPPSQVDDFFVLPVSPLGCMTEVFDEIDYFSFFQALDGFVIVLTRDFEVFYASETVQEYLGLAQVI